LFFYIKLPARYLVILGLKFNNLLSETYAYEERKLRNLLDKKSKGVRQARLFGHEGHFWQISVGNKRNKGSSVNS